MRLLVIGHSYQTAYYQQKFAAMKAADPSLELRIVVPQGMKSLWSGDHKLAPPLVSQEVLRLREFFGTSHMTFIFDPISLIKVIRDFKPDSILIEEDPHSLSGLESALFARFCAPKAELIFFIWDNLARVPKFPLRIIKRLFTSISMRRVSGMICGNSEAMQLLQTVKGYKGPARVLPQLGIDPEQYAGAALPRIQTRVGSSGEPVIAFLGRLVPEKGVLNLIQALHGIQDIPWKLLIIGGGPLSAVVRSEWETLWKGRLTFLDPLPHEEVAEFLKCIDILVLPSLSVPWWKEQFGHVLIEAMAAGKVLIGSSSGAIPEVVGDAGLIFREGDVPMLRELLSRLLQSPDERSQWSQKALARSRQFSHDAVARAYLDALASFRRTKLSFATSRVFL